MKKLIEIVLAAFLYLVSKVYTYSYSLSLKGKRDLLYTMWLRNFIGHVGEKTIFCYPIRLQGGGNKKISIGNRTIVKTNSILGCWEHHGEYDYKANIVIGDDCSIGEYCHITAINKITIGNGLLTGRFVYIGDNAHGGLSLEEALIPPSIRALKSKGEIVIGNNVWIGDKVTVLGGVTIGDNVIVGANSVVTHDIPHNSIAHGVPAKVIKRL